VFLVVEPDVVKWQNDIMNYFLPSFITINNVNRVINFYQQVLCDTAQKIICDASQLKFIDPTGFGLLAALCYKLQARGISIELINVPTHFKAYLAKMSLFKTYGIEDFKENGSRFNPQNVVELLCIQERLDVDDCSYKLAEAIVGKVPGVDKNAPPDEMTGYTPYDKITIPLRYIFSELLENSLTHGKRHNYRDTKVWVALQYEPAKDLIRLATVDNGCGFLKSLYREKLTEHIEAINLALEPRVTCNGDFYLRGANKSVNQGVGLSVVKEIVTTTPGKFYLASGDALFKVKPNASISKIMSYWQGVIIALDLKTDDLKEINLPYIINSITNIGSDLTLQFE